MHDLLMTNDWDIQPNWQGGLYEDDGDVIDYQDINFRVQTNNPEFAFGSVGANLENIIGKPNNASTGGAGQFSIISALTFDSRFSAKNVAVQAVPISFSEIQFFITINKVDLSFNTVPFFSTVVPVNL